MPYYDFKCTECGKEINVKLGMEEVKPDSCECGGSLKRDYKKVAVDNSSRRDPSAHNYWRKGKSDSEIADVLTGDQEPY